MSSSLLVESSLIGKTTIAFLESKNFKEISSYASKGLLMINNFERLNAELMKILSQKKTLKVKFRKRKNLFNLRMKTLNSMVKKLMN